jgi:hypothetical protein
MQHPTMVKLAVGESIMVPIRARLRWNKTGLLLFQGQEYHLVASGRWKDAYITATADGYEAGPDLLSRIFLRIFERWRRAPSENWFLLMGAVNSQEDAAFPIGAERQWVAVASGELTCFANDVPCAYWNNIGQIRLTIRRVR